MQTKVDNKRQGVRIRGGGVVAAASAPSVTPIESRISGDMSRDLVAPSATASSCRARSFSDSSSSLLLLFLLILAVSFSNLAIAIATDVRKSLVALASTNHVR